MEWSGAYLSDPVARTFINQFNGMERLPHISLCSFGKMGRMLVFYAQLLRLGNTTTSIKRVDIWFHCLEHRTSC